MKISLINLNLVAQDAIGTCLINQARLFLRRGDDVHIYVCYPPEGVPEELAAHISVVTLADLIGGRCQHFDQSDLFIYHYPSRHPLMESIKGIERGVVIFYYHNVTPPELWGTSDGRDELARGVAGITLAHYADMVIADSPFNADELIERGGVDRSRVWVLPLAVSFDRFSPGPKNAQLVQHYGLEGQRVIMFVGRMAGNKRIDLLIEALALVKARIPNVKLLLVGDCDSSTIYREISERARKRAAELGVMADVIFTGRVDELPDYYRTADGYVTASLHEGFGVPLIEAMASGVPVIASRAGAMPWVLGEAGLLCEPGDARDLSNKIVELFQDDARRKELIQRGLERARDFSIARYEDGLLKAIDGITQPVLTSGLRAIPLEPASALVLERTVEAMLTDDVRELSVHCDVALRDYVVRSNAPLVGPLIAWVRRNLTSHLREPYLDPTVERQVEFNRRVADLLLRINDLRAGRLHRETGRLPRQIDAPEAQSSGIELQTNQTVDLDARLRLIESRLDSLAAQVDLLAAQFRLHPDPSALEQQVEQTRTVMQSVRQELSSNDQTHGHNINSGANP